jgi:hypothetical protein
VFKTYIEQLQQLSGRKYSNDCRKCGKSNSQSEKGTESQNDFRTQIGKFEPIQSSLNLSSKQNGKFELFLSLSKCSKYQASHVHTKPFKTIPLSFDSNLVTQSL